MNIRMRFIVWVDRHMALYYILCILTEILVGFAIGIPIAHAITGK
jgi:hypothetical protein